MNLFIMLTISTGCDCIINLVQMFSKKRWHSNVLTAFDNVMNGTNAKTQVFL